MGQPVDPNIDLNKDPFGGQMPVIDPPKGDGKNDDDMDDLEARFNRLNGL